MIPRECMGPNCRRKYWRVNKIHVWRMMRVNGVIKPVRVIIKLCMTCCDTERSQSIVTSFGWKKGPRQ